MSDESSCTVTRDCDAVAPISMPVPVVLLSRHAEHPIASAAIAPIPFRFSSPPVVSAA